MTGPAMLFKALLSAVGVTIEPERVEKAVADAMAMIQAAPGAIARAQTVLQSIDIRLGKLEAEVSMLHAHLEQRRKLTYADLGIEPVAVESIAPGNESIAPGNESIAPGNAGSD